VLDADLSGRPSKHNDTKLDISDLLRSPLKSLRKLAQQKDIGLATAHTAVQDAVLQENVWE
jgi:hypothetical protein